MITKEELDKLANKYDTKDFIKDDPILFPHRGKTKEDKELYGFIASLFAYGNRKMFIKKLEDLDIRADNDIKNYILSLGDDVSENILKHYIAFRKLKNIVCVETSYKDKLILRLRLDTDTFPFEKDFSRNTTGIGHLGSGDVELTIRNNDDFEKAKPYLMQVYNEN